MLTVCISSGHGKHVPGAVGYLNEVDEARRTVDRVAHYLRIARVGVATFHDDTSRNQGDNLSTIVNWHNAREPHDLDVSIHFNAYQRTSKPMGTECCYLTQHELATTVASAIAAAGDLINRGPKYRTDLYFLNHTKQPAILIEICFVDSLSDCHQYETHFEQICRAIAQTLAPAQPSGVLFSATGRCSSFGGPDDTGVAPDEGLAFLYQTSDAPTLFLPQQPPGTTGLARRLDPKRHYVACRWQYDATPKTMLADQTKFALVSAGSRHLLARPADWGPHEDTARIADISPGLMEALGIETDDEVTVIYPAEPEV